MKIWHPIAWTLLGGIALGAIVVQSLHAQSRPPTYVVIDISAYSDPEGFKAILANASASPAGTAQLGGRYVIRSEAVTALQGTPPKRFVVIAFDSKEKAQAWYDAPETKAVNAIRNKTTTSRVFAVEGFAN
jgi:uncharacterized protein (DUF1330 family)